MAAANITMSYTKSDQTVRRLVLLRRQLQRAPGNVWLLLVPFMVFMLYLIYELQLLPCTTNTTLLLDLKVQARLIKINQTQVVGRDDETLTRLQKLERKVTDSYLHIQLTLAASSGSLHPTAGSLLADVGTLQGLHTFQPLLTPREKAHLLYLFELFSKICQRNYLTFFLLGSSLVGSVRHQGIIPWSDVSIKVAVDERDKVRILEVLDNIDGAVLMWPNPHSWTLRLKDWHPDPPHMTRMPFLHIQFYQQNYTHVWADKWDNMRLFTAAKERVLPPVLRPFEGQLTFTPCDPRAVLTRKELETCLVVREDLEEKVWHDAGLVNCDILAKVFPFVRRRVSMSAESTLEQVMINGTLLYSAMVNTGSCESDSHRFLSLFAHG